MNSARAVFLDTASLDLGDLDLQPLRQAFGELVLHPASAPGEIAGRLREANVAISNKAPISAETLAQCPDLKLILVTATGTNNVALAAARERGIAVANCQGYGTASVAQHAILLLLALATRLPDYQAAVRAGRWQQSTQFCLLDFPIVELEGKTLGLLGHGELGGAVARLAEAFGMRVLLGQLPGRPPRADRLALDELLPQVDAISLHCPLTEQTRGMIGKEQLAMMKPNAIIVNEARGAVIDDKALVEALQNGTIWGAAIDTWEKEPLDPNDPLVKMEKVITTSHLGAATRETVIRCFSIGYQNILRQIHGEELVNRIV